MLLVLVAVVHEGGPSPVWSRVTDCLPLGRDRPCRRDSQREAAVDLRERPHGLLARRVARSRGAPAARRRRGKLRPLVAAAGARPGYGALDAHNLYLETLAELGPIGLALVLAALAVPLATLRAVAAETARRGLLAPPTSPSWPTPALDWDWELSGVGLAGLLCGAAVVAAADPGPATIRRPLRAAGTTVVLALAASCSCSTSATSRSQQARPRSTATTPAPPSVTPGGPGAGSRGRRSRSSPCGEAQLSAGDVGAAAATFARAVRQDAGDWQAWYDLGLSTRGGGTAQRVESRGRSQPACARARGTRSLKGESGAQVHLAESVYLHDDRATDVRGPPVKRHSPPVSLAKKITASAVVVVGSTTLALLAGAGLASTSSSSVGRLPVREQGDDLSPHPFQEAPVRHDHRRQGRAQGAPEARRHDRSLLLAELRGAAKAKAKARPPRRRRPRASRCPTPAAGAHAEWLGSSSSHGQSGSHGNGNGHRSPSRPEATQTTRPRRRGPTFARSYAIVIECQFEFECRPE